MRRTLLLFGSAAICCAATLIMELARPIGDVPSGVSPCDAAGIASKLTEAVYERKRLEAVRELRKLGTFHLHSGQVLRSEADCLRTLRGFEGRYDASVLEGALPYLPQLEEITLELKAGESLGAAEHIAALRRLKRLRIKGPEFDSHRLLTAHCKQPDADSADITDDQMKALGKLKTLETLSIRNCRITDAELACLDGLANLRILYLSRTCVTCEAFRTIARFPKIEEVAVYYHLLDQPIDARTHHAVASLDARLKRLLFGEWGETRVHPSLLAAIGKVQSLTFLDLGDFSHMRPEDLEPLKGLKDLTHLEGSASLNSPVFKAFEQIQRQVMKQSRDSLKPKKR